MFTLAFWMATLERGVKTLAQSAAALLVVDGLGILTVDWASVSSVAGLAGIVSVLTSVGIGAATDGTPSAVKAETLTAGTRGKHVDLSK